MLSLKPPTDAALAAKLAAAADETAHAVIDGGLEVAPAGYWHNERMASVGSGDVDFEIARQALRDWLHFPSEWARPIPDGPTEVGQHVAIIARACGLVVTNICRVAQVTEHHSEDWSTFAIVYTTVASHDMVGAERFRLSWNKATDRVTYQIASYSRPNSLLTRLTLPYVRSLQRTFCEQSCEIVADKVAKFRRSSVTANTATA